MEPSDEELESWLSSEPAFHTGSITEFTEGMFPLITESARYRDEAARQGFSESAAEMMAVEFHSNLMHQTMHMYHQALEAQEKQQGEGETT
jgi:hypothetical protein